MGAVQFLSGMGYTAAASIAAAGLGFACDRVVRYAYDRLIVDPINMRRIENSRTVIRLERTPPQVKVGSAVMGIYVMTKALQVAGVILAVPSIIKYAAIAAVAVVALSACYQRGSERKQAPVKGSCSDITAGEIKKLEISQPDCFERLPCDHQVMITLQDGRQACASITSSKIRLIAGVIGSEKVEGIIPECGKDEPGLTLKTVLGKFGWKASR